MTSIAFVGYGEVASLFAQALQANGARVSAYDVLLDRPDGAVLGNQVEILFGALPPLLVHVQAGKLRALAISSGKRSASAPDVPTVAEAGFPGFDMSLWLGFFAPKGTPPAVVKRLETELLAVARSPELKAALEKQGLEAHPLGASELAALLRSDLETYRNVFQAAKIPVQ